MLRFYVKGTCLAAEHLRITIPLARRLEIEIRLVGTAGGDFELDRTVLGSFG